MTYAETPFGNALARMGHGERCSTTTVLICPSCRTVYPDHCDDDPGTCGPCEHSHRYTFRPTQFRLRRRKRRPEDVLELSFRY